MKAIILIALLCCANLAAAQTIEDQVEAFVKQEAPFDPSMQNYLYKNQMDSYRYMETVNDAESKALALREYPNDYEMQQFTYNQLVQ